MKNIVEKIQDLRDLIVMDSTVGGRLLEVEEMQWLRRLDKIKLEAESLFNNVGLANVRLSLIDYPTNELQIGWNLAMQAIAAKIEVKDVTPITFSELKIKLGIDNEA